MKRVIEAVKVVEEADHRRQLDDLSIVEVLLELCPDIFVYAVRVGRHALCQSEGGALGRSEEVPMLINVVHRVEQVLSNA
jgi:hypothetical protein